ncbi:MAG: nucleotidyltransferase [Sarcina sp.]
MKITGIITEYNPFHKGHEFHLKNCKKDTLCEGVLCIMSGNFVQRGLPAITDKWSRAQMALDAGVDLVIELPTLFATASAEFFAFGAISILDKINIVNNIYFGSEYGSTDLLIELSKILAFEPIEFQILLKEKLKTGLPFPKARALALEKYLMLYMKKNYNFSILDFLNNSNNILGIEYCKNIIRLSSKINIFTLKRQGSSYNSINIEDNKFASATAIRNSLLKENSLNPIKEFLPNSTYNILNTQKYFPDMDSMFNYIKYITIINPNLVNNIKDANEGLGNKILIELSKATSFEDLISRCKSKRYTYTRISRCLCHIFLGIDTSLYSLINTAPDYIRVLALNTTGAKILKEIKKHSDIKIITKVPKNIVDPLLKLDIQATNLYSLLNPSIVSSSDYLISPKIAK